MEASVEWPRPIAPLPSASGRGSVFPSSRAGVQQMRDHPLLAGRQQAQRDLLREPVGLRGSLLVLAEVNVPRVHLLHLDEAPRVGSVTIQTPLTGA
jgi:hypothetical protein